jgi:hypothetical protein
VRAFWIRADLDEAAFHGDELPAFGPAALQVFKTEKLLKRGEDLRMVECGDCGNLHIEDVDIIIGSPDGAARAYIACGAGRASVDLVRLQVWAIDFDRLADLASSALGLGGRIVQVATDRVWHLGTAKFADRTRDVFLVRGIRWPDSLLLLSGNARLSTSPCPLILCMNRVPDDAAWQGERAVVSLSEFDWLEGDRSTLLKKVTDILGEYPRPPELTQQRMFRKEGDFWSIRFDGKTIRLKDGKGPVYLSYLLSQPGHDFPAVELLKAVSGAAVVTARSSAGTAIDEKARTQYKTRALEIQDELADARKLNDSGRVAALQEELEKIAGQMTAATGLGGRRRLVGDTSEKARKSVSAAVSRTVRQAGAANSSLGKHLQKHVSSGAALSYQGDGTPWNF